MAESERFELSIQRSPYTRFPGVLLQPLGQLSMLDSQDIFYCRHNTRYYILCSFICQRKFLINKNSRTQKPPACLTRILQDGRPKTSCCRIDTPATGSFVLPFIIKPQEPPAFETLQESYQLFALRSVHQGHHPAPIRLTY